MMAVKEAACDADAACDCCVMLTTGVTKDDVLKAAALAAKWKEPPRDALDTLVLLNSGLDLTTLDVYEQVSPNAKGAKDLAAGGKGQRGGVWKQQGEEQSHQQSTVSEHYDKGRVRTAAQTAGQHRQATEGECGCMCFCTQTCSTHTHKHVDMLFHPFLPLVV